MRFPAIVPYCVIASVGLWLMSCSPVADNQRKTAEAGNRSLHWYRQAIVDLGYRVTMFSPHDGIAISRGIGKEFNGKAYRFRNGAWIPFHEFPYSDYPLIVSRDSSEHLWTVNHLTHDGAYRPVHTEFTGTERRTIGLPAFMWDEKDFIMYKGIHQFRDGTAWMVGQQGHILYYDGRQWMPEGNPLIRSDRINVYEGDLNDIFMISKHSGWAVGRNGIILRWESGRWQIVLSPTRQTLHRVKFLGEGLGWAVGDRGTIIKWNGTSWIAEESGTRETLNSLKIVDSADVWIAGNSSTLLKYDGSAWSAESSVRLYEDNFVDLDIVADSTGEVHHWIIGNKGIYTTSNSTGFSFTDITEQVSLQRSGRGGIFFHAGDEAVPQLYVLGDGGMNLLFEFTDNAHYADITEQAGLTGIPRTAGMTALGDVNNDGNIDILSINDSTDYTFLFGTMFGGFRDATAFSRLALQEIDPAGMNAVRFVDLDNDGNLDLYISNFDLPDQIFRNDGAGRFTRMMNPQGLKKITGHSSYGAAFGDFNNDGLLDIFIPYYISYGDTFFTMFVNRGNFRFQQVDDPLFHSSADLSPTVAVPGDFNNDGRTDIFVHCQKSPPLLLVADSSGKFFNAAPAAGLTALNFHPEPANGVAAVADVNNDGWPDIFDGSKLYLNSPRFYFTEVSERVGIQFTGNPSFADIDDDGDMDLVIGSSRSALGKGDRAALFRNNLDPHAFAKVTVKTDKSNRSGIGTKLLYHGMHVVTGVSSSPMLPQADDRIIVTPKNISDDSMTVVFPSGTIVRTNLSEHRTVYETGYPGRALILMFRSLHRTFLQLRWEWETGKLFIAVLFWLGFIRVGRRLNAGAVVRSPYFAMPLAAMYLLLTHLLIDAPLAVSSTVSLALFGATGIAVIVSARSIIRKRNEKFISHYKLVQQIGAGGMGTVWKAVDTTNRSTVALKVLNPELLKDAENKRRLSAEGHLLSSFDHPNIVKVFEVGESNGRGYIAMEYLAGGTVKDRLDRSHPLLLSEIKEYILQVCGGLAEVHAKGIVHRDLKTGNLMIGGDGRIRIMDFGLSKSPLVTTMTSLGTVLGTLGYVAPEQVTGMDVDARTDIFSLGVVLYELLTRELPFKGENEIALIHAIFNAVPPPPSHVRNDISAAWDAVVMRCLAKESRDRFASVDELGIHVARLETGIDG